MLSKQQKLDSCKRRMLIRELREEDKPFVYNSFLRSVKPHFFGITGKKFYQKATALLDKWLNTPDYKISICSSYSDTRVILGYCIHNTECDHIYYAFTKHAFRKLGVLSYLVNHYNPEGEEFTYTFETYSTTKMSKGTHLPTES